MPFTHDDIAKVTLQWNAEGIGMALNVFNCLLAQNTPHTLSDGDARDDFETWMEAIFAPMEPHIVVSYSVTGILVHKWEAPDWVFQFSGLPDITSESIGDPLPSGVAALITAYTDHTKRRGRKFIPGMSELAQTAGAWILTVLGAMGTSALAWIQPFTSVDTGSTWYPVAWSPKYLEATLFNGRIGLPDVPAYQRRRKEGVGG